MENSTIVNSVLMTTDYSIFKFMDANRNVDQLNVLRLESEMKKHQYETPIIVNDNMEVIDGQHRLIVCEKNKLPVYYLVIPGLTERDCRKLNQNQKEWSTNDYLNYYSKIGSKSAKRLLDLSTQFNISAGTVMRASGHDSRIVTSIKYNDNTDWMDENVFTENDHDVAYDRLAKADDIAKILADEHKINRANVMKSVIHALKTDGFDYDRLANSCKEMGSLYSWRAPLRRIAENLCKVYNRGHRKNFMDVIATPGGYRMVCGVNENRWRM